MPSRRDVPKEKAMRAGIELSAEDVGHLKRLLSLVGTAHEASIGAPISEVHTNDGEVLHRRAQWIRAFRLKRHELLPEALFGEPAWDVLIELFLAHDRERMAITVLADRAGVALTTLLRWLNYLSDLDLISVLKNPTDARMSFIELTGKGLAAMTRFFRALPPMPDQVSANSGSTGSETSPTPGKACG